jgi:GTPase SAR1 family protein
VLLGDAGCGKTSLALAYCGQSLPEDHVSDAAPFNVVAKAAGVQVGEPVSGLGVCRQRLNKAIQVGH